MENETVPVVELKEFSDIENWIVYCASAGNVVNETASGVAAEIGNPVKVFKHFQYLSVVCSPWKL